MYEVKFLLLAVFSISLLACSQSQVTEQEALDIAYGWADERGVFEPVDKWMPILREADVFSNDNYFVVMFKYDVTLVSMPQIMGYMWSSIETMAY